MRRDARYDPIVEGVEIDRAGLGESEYPSSQERLKLDILPLIARWIAQNDPRPSGFVDPLDCF
jgi:hypothetical protein